MTVGKEAIGKFVEGNRQPQRNVGFTLACYISCCRGVYKSLILGPLSHSRTAREVKIVLPPDGDYRVLPELRYIAD